MSAVSIARPAMRANSSSDWMVSYAGTRRSFGSSGVRTPMSALFESKIGKSTTSFSCHCPDSSRGRKARVGSRVTPPYTLSSIGA